MTLRVALNGFGRIGRNIFRVLYERDDIVIAVISDVAAPENLLYLLKHDTLAGRFREPVELVGGALVARGRLIPFANGKAPGDVKWRDYDVDVVIEASGRYRSRESLERHLEAGARRVVLTVPPKAKSGIPTYLRGINDSQLKGGEKIISAGSLALNALAPVVQSLDKAFGIANGFYTLVHAYTGEQTLGDVYKPSDLSVDDVPADDLRRSRSAPENIIPATKHSPVPIGSVLPSLESKLGGMAVSGAVSDGSVIDLVTFHDKVISEEQVQAVMRSAANTDFKGILEYSTEDIVSADVTGSKASGIFDSLMCSVTVDTKTEGAHRTLIKTLTWYDNGWSFAHRVVELVEALGATL